jgi:hypothetical protein
MTNKSVPLLILIVLLVSACGGSITILSTPSATPLNKPQPVADNKNISTTQSNAWKTVRDPRYGFGLAVPCWWLVSPIPAQGIGGVMTIQNYDEAYFNAHSTKGFWEWPNGTLKLDIIVMEGVDPTKSDADAYMAFVDPTATGLVSAETQQIGVQKTTVLTLSNLVNTNDPDARMFAYRLAPDKLLMVAPTPQSIINTPDFQAILSSIVLSPGEQVSLPIITPAPALVDSTCAQ